MQAKSKKSARSNSSASSELTVGAQVCMKNSPLYQAGAIGFTISNGVPRVGQLLNSAWDLTDICRFKIITITPTSNASSTLTSSDLKDLLKAANSSTSSNVTKPSTAGNNKENADRLDMPPPPSPASSTCSDTGSVTSHKRAKRSAPKEESEPKKDEEQWMLKDVVFVEDTRSIPIGRILKVDGYYAAVRFPTTTNSDQLKEDVDAWQDCRLMKKDELQLVKSATTSRIPDCFQKTPRRIVFSVAATSSSSMETHSQQLLSIAVDNKGIHGILRTGSKLHYCLHNMNTGRMEYDSAFPTDTNAFLGLSQSNISLTCANETADSVLLLRDGNSTIYPLIRDCLDAIRDPHWFDLQPIRCMAATTLTLNSVAANMKSQIAILALVPETQLLMQRILRCDFKGFKNVLNQIEANSDPKAQITSITNERCDGNRNILHACVAMCSPTSNKDADEAAGPTNHTTQSALDNIEFSMYPIQSSSRVREMMRRSRDIDAIGSNSNTGSQDDSAFAYWSSEYSELNSDPAERRENASLILKQLCGSAVLQPFLKQLLCAKDAHGQTPFMASVALRAYNASKILFDVIQQIANGDSALRDAMIYPTGSADNQSPLYVLCCNDTCSFTWTGADHINQDIFECRTCGLTGSLCCCTECAKVCHKGHDCKLKKTSPTAYCDCWEKCKCKALIAGNQKKRFELLEKIVAETDLVRRVNSRGEPILLFLIQTVGRQTSEQRQYRSRARNTTSSRKTPSLDAENEMPDHDLEPPRFAKKALDHLLLDWNAVKSMITTGTGHEKQTGTDRNESLDGQTGTTLLDKFTHSLFVRCNGEPLDTLLNTLNRELQNTRVANRVEEAQRVARRFVRSVARVFVVFSLERSPNPEKKSNTQTKHIQTCRRVFQTLIKISIEELIETADALIVPVRMGVVRPTAPFSISSLSTDNPDDLFSVEPLAPSATRDGANEDSRMSGLRSGMSNVGVDPEYVLRQLGADTDNDAAADNAGDDEEVSEQDDTQSERDRHNSTRSNNDEEALREVVAEGESDNEFFHEAETESDSDDNQSIQDAQPSVQTRATVGSDTGKDHSYS